MNKHVIRLVALLLVPCMLADLGLASAFTQTKPVFTQPSSVYLEQAFASREHYGGERPEMFHSYRAGDLSAAGQLSRPNPVPHFSNAFKVVLSVAGLVVFGLLAVWAWQHPILVVPTQMLSPLDIKMSTTLGPFYSEWILISIAARLRWL